MRFIDSCHKHIYFVYKIQNYHSSVDEDSNILGYSSVILAGKQLLAFLGHLLPSSAGSRVSFQFFPSFFFYLLSPPLVSENGGSKLL